MLLVDIVVGTVFVIVMTGVSFHARLTPDMVVTTLFQFYYTGVAHDPRCAQHGSRISVAMSVVNSQ